MSSLILDSEPVYRLAQRAKGRKPGRVHSALKAAEEVGSEVWVPAAVLAEVYRGGSRNQSIDSCLGRNTGIQIMDTTRKLARVVGGLLEKAGSGSEDHVDATLVATAMELGGGVILTSDPRDLAKLAAGIPGIDISAV